MFAPGLTFQFNSINLKNIGGSKYIDSLPKAFTQELLQDS